MPLPITAVCTEIGRGHPQYLDSVLDALRRQGITDIPRMVPRWRLARLGYRLGAQGGMLTALYGRLRSDRPSRILLRLLDEGLRRRFRNHPGIVLVDHPLLAHLLGPVCRVAYIHGEIAAPLIAAVPSAWRSFVPLQATADKLTAQGVPQEALRVCGLLIEPELLAPAENGFTARLERFVSGRPLNIGFFTSGAYPRPHQRQIIAGLHSCLAAGCRATLFTGTDPRVAVRSRAQLGHLPGLLVSSARNRQEENALTARLLPGLDLMIAPAHERTNWAVGLGLPMLILGPDIGPFAPLNREYALAAGVARPLEDARQLGSTVNRLRAEGRLAAKAEAGRNRHPVNGAETAARQIAAG